MQLAVDEESGRRLSGPFGSDILSIPSSVIDEFARPFSTPTGRTGDLFPKAKTVRGERRGRGARGGEDGVALRLRVSPPLQRPR